MNLHFNMCLECVENYRDYGLHDRLRSKTLFEAEYDMPDLGFVEDDGVIRILPGYRASTPLRQSMNNQSFIDVSMFFRTVRTWMNSASIREIYINSVVEPLATRIHDIGGRVSIVEDED